MAQDVKQTVTFNARPSVIFEMLMDARKHTAFTGAPAKISRKPGGAFSCYGGQLTGVTLETQKGKLIVQAWRAKRRLVHRHLQTGRRAGRQIEARFHSDRRSPVRPQGHRPRLEKPLLGCHEGLS